MIDKEEKRLRAYQIWEREGRPEGGISRTSIRQLTAKPALPVTAPTICLTLLVRRLPGHW